MRIFPDTNVLVAALATRGLCAELFEAILQSHDLLTCEQVLEELRRILIEKIGLSDSIAEGFVNLLRDQAIVIAGASTLPSLPDPDDEEIIAAAVAGGADVFVTGDKTLLNLQSIAQLPILSPRMLWELLSGSE